MPGTFYVASSPEADPFVKVGDSIKKGETLCIIEAMKIMNEIEAEYNGVISEVLIKNGDPVEYNQPLFKITPS
jgi:acetyl-CoA carboxylase biotin carboxyl carrier protein